MESEFADINLSAVAGAIADPARARMLCQLLDGRARTATELAVAADIGASTASSHFQRLREQGLVDMAVQGKHRYFRLANSEVAHALEALLVVAGAERAPFKPNTPSALREARTCYDHMAGTLAVRIHDAMLARQWLVADGRDYVLTPLGEASLAQVGVDVAQARQRRRRFACSCLD
ncbi:MAG: ArsR/SmtB family transcription factor, partial [Achromobacter pestifer]